MSIYKDYRAVQQPKEFRTWREAVRRQRIQLVVLAMLFVAGAAVFLASPLAGSLIMLGAGISLPGTLIGGRYFE